MIYSTMPVFSKWIIFLLGYTFLGNSICNGLRCYVCDTDKNNCENFDIFNKNFTTECPAEKSASCIQVVSNGRVTHRDCEELKLDVCSTANGIQYCYCSKELCNDRWQRNEYDDDEDGIFEGSGIFLPPIVVDSTSTAIIPVTVSVTTQTSIPSITSCLRIEMYGVIMLVTIQYFIRQYYY